MTNNKENKLNEETTASWNNELLIKIWNVQADKVALKQRVAACVSERKTMWAITTTFRVM